MVARRAQLAREQYFEGVTMGLFRAGDSWAGFVKQRCWFGRPSKAIEREVHG